MKPNETDPMENRVHATGNPWVPSYFIDVSPPILFDAGLAFLGPAYIRQIRQLSNGQSPAWLFLTHAHFDHCGAAAALKKAFPTLRVAASEKAAAILSRENAVRLIEQLNREAARMAVDLGDGGDPQPFEPFQVDRTVGEGDRIELDDGNTVHVLETPGHTRDSLSYYLPQRRLLFTGEAAGVGDQTGYIYSEWLVDAEQYRLSLDRLAGLDVETLCPGHNRVYRGDEVPAFFTSAVEHYDAFYGLIRTCLLEEAGDVERVMARVRKQEYDGKPDPKQAETAYLLNLDAKIRAVWRRMNHDHEA